MLSNYDRMIPAYMKEDQAFSKVYQYIEDVFEQIKQTCQDIKNDIRIDSNSKAFLKLLSLFGQSEVFSQEGIRVYGLKPIETGFAVMKTDSETPIMLNIPIVGLVSYYSSRFNILKNGFNGTFRGLKDSLSKVFTYSSENDVYKNAMSISCYQDIIQDSVDGDNHPHIMLRIILSQDLKKEGVFPPEEAYAPHYEYNIDYILDSWLNDPDHPENITMYNFYKEFLDVLTLFENDYFKINILGVITEFEISGNSPILKWNESVWNEAQWSGDYIVEEE